MVGFEVFRNGERLCLAGVPTGVLTATLLRVGHEEQAESLQLRVGGLTGDTHLTWLIEPLANGDEVSVRIREAARIDEPLPPEPEDRAQAIALARKKHANLLKQVAELEAKWGDELQPT